MPRLFLTASEKENIHVIDGRTRHRNGVLLEIKIGNERLEVERSIPLSHEGDIAMDGHHKLNGGVVVNGLLYAATYGAVVEIDLLTGRQEIKVTSPLFNDLHHVAFNGDCFAVVNSGLEVISYYDKEWGHIADDNLLERFGFDKTFCSQTDYRYVWSTKPHCIHPNHITFHEGEWWVTRFIQKDFIGLKSGKRFSVEDLGNPHDGVLRSGGIYLTTTNGKIVRFDINSGERRVWDITSLLGCSEPIGWCRGVEIIGGRAYVCFTKFRGSKTKEMMKWVVGIRNTLPSQIVEIDLLEARVIGCYELAIEDLTLFNIFAK